MATIESPPVTDSSTPDKVNWLAEIRGLGLMLLMGVLATIPLFIGWLLVGPMLLLYSYAVYRDLFFGRA